jgi:hypothetical protein
VNPEFIAGIVTAKNKLVGSAGEKEEDRREETKRKTQERIESRCRRSSSSAGSEKMERDGDRWDKMEGHCSTGQSLQWAVAPMEEEEEEEEEERQWKKKKKKVTAILEEESLK